MRASEWVKANAARYFEKCTALEKVTQRLTLRQVLAFVLFTPQLRYEQSVNDWKLWMRDGSVRPNNMWRMRMLWLTSMPAESALNSMITGHTLWESVDMLVGGVRGLGYAKAPFFLSLLFPTHQEVPVCTDIHILRAVGVWPCYPTRFQLGRAQERMQRRARRAGIPSFTYQWALWDYTRSKGEPVKETSIERDLVV